MADDQNAQSSNTDQNPLENERPDSTSTFGERVENTSGNDSDRLDSVDHDDELNYRDHDEFGEWLDRDN